MIRLAGLTLLLAALAAPPPARAPLAAPEPDAVALALFLIGDAGKPAKGGEPVLQALRHQLERTAARSTVVFLGDNLYPAGLPAPGHPDLPEMRRRLDDQVSAVAGTGARVVFIPGNHDWEKGGPDGWEAVRRQERRVEERGGAGVSHLPNDGCPGPEVVDVGDRLRLVALDTQWWLHSHARPEHPTSSCAADSEDEVVTAFRAALESAGERDVVVLAHHPLVSGGPHGGKFGLKQHLFPLTEYKPKLWVPLPILGSLYPAARASGVSPQDQPSAEYGRMRRALAGAMRGHRPLAWASGHEHVLQVIESREWGRVLVSGTGIYGHVTHARNVEGSLYRSGRSGFMRIDLLRDGQRRLGVVEVASDGRYREGFARRLE
jgi:Calcineurin-like phosphoesterase